MNIDPDAYHRISAAKLVELLQELPEGYSVQPNEVRNLAVLDPNGVFAGFVDLGSEEVVWATPPASSSPAR